MITYNVNNCNGATVVWCLKSGTRVVRCVRCGALTFYQQGTHRKIGIYLCQKQK